MQAIETVYNGHRFRSRLEARWAVFLDALHVPYEYEPEGFILDNGMWYLPDFRVICWGTRGNFKGPQRDLYIEVKGQMTEEDEAKIRSFSGLPPRGKDGIVRQDGSSVLIVDKIPPHGIATDSYIMGAYEHMPGSTLSPFNYETIDGDYFGAYPAATKDGHFYLFGDEGSYINRDDELRVRDAYDRARMAQFEHGVSG